MELPVSIYVTGSGRRWTAWATNVPSGGTSVDTWARFSKRSALRKAERVRRKLAAERIEERIDIQ